MPPPAARPSPARTRQLLRQELRLEPATEWGGGGQPLAVPAGVEAVIGRQQPRALGITDVHVSRSHARLTVRKAEALLPETPAMAT